MCPLTVMFYTPWKYSIISAVAFHNFLLNKTIMQCSEPPYGDKANKILFSFANKLILRLF